MLVDASVRFMESEHPLATVRRGADGEAYDDVAYRRTAAELGWFGMLADEEHGGGSMSGNGVLDAALVAVERGARLQPGPFVGHNAVVHALSSTGSHDTVLDDLVTGQAWATWTCGSERSCTVRADGDGLRLSGTIPVVADGAACTWLFVDAARRRGRRAAPCAHRRTRREHPRTGRHRRDPAMVCRRAHGCRGDRGRRCRRIRRRISASSPRCSPRPRSSARWTTTSTWRSQYAKDRIAFGRPIGSFQAVKHLLADTSLALEMSKALTLAAAPRRSERRRRRPPSSRSMAKAFVGDARHRAGADLLPGLRRHRLHVGARPAPLPPPHHHRRRAVRRRRRGTASTCASWPGSE